MKKTAVIALVCVLAVSMCACANTEESSAVKQGSYVQSAAGSDTEQSKNGSSEAIRTTSDETAAEADYETALFGNDILQINISADEKEWKEFLENAASKPWIQCNIDINVETYNDVGIKTKGNTSLQQLVNDDTTTRYSLKVSFGKYTEGQTCHGLDKLALNNIYADSTYLKEYMSYDLMKFMDVPSSLCTFAEIKVNGEHYGFCLAIEDPDDSYIDRIYGSDSSVEAYKPESMDMDGNKGDFPGNMQPGQNGDGNDQFPQMPGQNGDSSNQPPQMPGQDGDSSNQPPQMPGQNGDSSNQPPQMPGQNGNNGKPGMDGGRNGVDLKYIDDNADSYSNIFDNSITKVNDEDKQRLIASLKKISEGEDIESCIDTDEMLRYIACNVFLVNLDSYLSSNCHNYILTEDNGKLSMLPWDYNLSFGSYQMKNANDAVNYAIDTALNNVSAEERPLISKLLEKDEYRQKYHEYLKEIVEKYIRSGVFEDKVNEITELIDEYVKNDTTSFDGYEAFKEGVETLRLFVKLRAESVSGQLDGSIPSTSEEQKGSDKLTDASAVDMKKLGTMNMGAGNNQGAPDAREKTG